MTSPADAAELPASIVSHVSIGTDDLDRAVAFHEAVLATLGIGIVERIGDVAVAFGRAFPEFWVQVPENEAPASVGNGTHVAFVAASRAEVDAFHEAALAAGATDEGAPGPRPHYGAPYYGCFVIDPAGHKLEATFWDVSLLDA